jgi:hypothetical protein
MTTPTDGPSSEEPVSPWQQPGGQPAGSGYGSPSSPSYGKYGQGQALPVPPPAPAPGAPGWGQPPGPQSPAAQLPYPQPGPAQSQAGWGQTGYPAPVPPQAWNNGPGVLQPVGRFVNPLIGLSALMGLGTVLTGALAPNQNQMVKDVFNGVTTATAAQGSVAYRSASALTLLVEIGLWVTTALWLTKVRQNAVLLNPRGQRRSEVWVWLAWIIPIVNFWFPKQLVDDALSTTAWARGEQRRMGTASWWTAWLVSLLFGGVLAVSSVFPPNHGLHLGLTAVDAVLTATALALWIRIVRRLSADQDTLPSRTVDTLTR